LCTTSGFVAATAVVPADATIAMPTTPTMLATNRPLRMRVTLTPGATEAARYRGTNDQEAEREIAPVCPLR
jgi:hypothetical protein